MTFHVITLFPHAFDSYLGESILKRAILDKKIKVKFYNPRDYAENKWRRIDRAPYGGGPGMVIQAEPVIRAIESALKNIKSTGSNYSLIRPPAFRERAGTNKRIVGASLRKKDKGLRVIWLSPSGKQFTNESGVRYAEAKDIVIICGRYEGIDARVKKAVRAMHLSSDSSPLKRGGKRWGGIVLEEVSVGPFVLTGGELPAMVMIDVIARQIEGVLGDFNSREESRVASPDVYTRPEVFTYKGRKLCVPKVLLTGHHAKIDEWKLRRRK
jgi:tRNA (guanine37-N1)-methyltransferase